MRSKKYPNYEIPTNNVGGFLHETMIIWETPLDDEECEYYHKLGIDLDNEDFKKWKSKALGK